MKSFILRLLSGFLAALLLFSFSACANGGGNTTPTPTEKPTDTPTAAPTEEEKITYRADLPAGLNYDNSEFMVYTFPKQHLVWKDFDWQNNGMDGDRIGQAVYTRTNEVNALLGVEIVSYQGKSYADPSELTQAIATGQDSFDIANVTMLAHVSMLRNSYLQEIHDLTALDVEAAWWDQNLLSDLSIAGSNFCLVGDIGTMYKRSISCILFNKKILNDRNLENPYTLATTGKWTLEKLTDMAMLVSDDLDGNGSYTDADLYGLIYFTNVITALEIGGGVQFAQKNEDDIPEMSLNDDLTVNILEDAALLLYDEEYSYNVYAHSQGEDRMWEMFMNDQALFYYGELHSAEDLRRMQSDFGILPIPTYEKNAAYCHTVNPNVASVLVIPKTNVELDKTAYILDALGAASKNILTPAYYDLNLQGVVSRDDESTVSLDIIIASCVYDPGFLLLRGASEMMRNLCVNRSLDFASAYEKVGQSLETEIANIVTAVENQ